MSCVGDHILQEFNILRLTKSRTYEIALPPKQKLGRGWGEGLRDKHLPLIPFTGQFF
jgi:hypothetical protein